VLADRSGAGRSRRATREKAGADSAEGTVRSVLLGLLVVNLVLSFATGRPQERRQVPYQPFFVEQLEAGNVKEISSRADSIEGALERATAYDPAGAAKRVKVKQFETQIPAFIDRAGLTRLLAQQDVTVNAQPLDDGRGFWTNLVLGFGPTLLLVAFS
jgi:cell division protease FtsH